MLVCAFTSSAKYSNTFRTAPRTCPSSPCRNTTPTSRATTTSRNARGVSGIGNWGFLYLPDKTGLIHIIVIFTRKTLKVTNTVRNSFCCHNLLSFILCPCFHFTNGKQFHGNITHHGTCNTVPFSKSLPLISPTALAFASCNRETYSISRFFNASSIWLYNNCHFAQNNTMAGNNSGKHRKNSFHHKESDCAFLID